MWFNILKLYSSIVLTHVNSSTVVEASKLVKIEMTISISIVLVKEFSDIVVLMTSLRVMDTASSGYVFKTLVTGSSLMDSRSMVRGSGYVTGIVSGIVSGIMAVCRTKVRGSSHVRVVSIVVVVVVMVRHSNL